MSTIMPAGEKVREAVRWISCEIQEDQEKKITKLIQDASIRFNLSPKDEEFLKAFYKVDE